MSSSTIVIDPDDGHTADEVRYRRLLNGMAEGVVETTPSGEFITTNDAFAVMLGYESSEDLMAGVANAVDLYANSTRRNVEVRRVVDEPGGVAEVEFRDKSGNPVWIRARSTLQYSPSGEVISIQAICEDITLSRRTDLQLAAIVDGSSDAIIGATTAGIVTSWNRAAERLFGFAADEIIGRSVALFAPADRAVEQAQMRERLTAGGAQESLETVRCRKDGSLVEVWINASTAIDPDGNVVGLSVIARDNTERRRALLALQASEQRLADAQRTAHIGSFEFDVVTGELTWSDEYYRILGLDLSVEPSIGLFRAMVHPDDLAKVEAVWADATKRGVAFDTEVRIVRVDSAVRYVRCRAIPEFADDGAVLTVCGTMMDDTERAEIERMRRAAETRFEIGFEQSAIGATIAGLDGLPTRVNPAMCTLLGRPESELIGHRGEEYEHPDQLPSKLISLALLTAGRDTFADERRYLRPDGSSVWASVHITLVRDESGEPQYYFAQFEDITERKRTELELFRNEERYRGLIESQQELIIRVDRADRCTFANDAYCAKFGFDRDAILGTSNVSSVVHPDDLVAARQALQSLDRPPYRSYVELRTFAVDGERWVGWEECAIRDAAGEVVEFQLVGRDIDDRKRAEAELTRRTHELEQAATMLDALSERVNRFRVSDHTIVYCNAAWATQYNVEPAVAIGRTLDEYLSDDELDGLHSQLALLGPDSPTLVDSVARAVHNAPGTWLEWADRYLTGPDGAVVLSVGRDVTGRHDAELKLAESEARFRDLADKSADVVWRFLIQPSPHFDYMSPSVENILGYPPSYFLEDFTRMLDIVDQAGNTTIERALRGEQILERFDFRFRHANGSIVVAETRTSAITGGVQGVSRDVTELRLLQETTAALALHDPLTGLANRRLFIELLDAYLARTERSGLSLAVAFVDLDDFKSVNDAFGHDVGDLVLCETARRLQSIVRGADTVARLGGDEFVVVYEPNDVNAHNLTRRIDQSLSQPLNVSPTIVLSCQASIGISNTSTVGYNSAALLAAADAAMYKVKRARQSVRDAQGRLHPTSVS
ncbi:MAG: PAS domain S-box protein [Ilumatobacteraceae bacterium]